MSQIDDILQQALRLPYPERARLVEQLQQSLHPPGEDVSEEEWQQAWAEEIKARSDAVHAGTAELLDAEEVLERLRQRLKEKQPQ